MLRRLLLRFKLPLRRNEGFFFNVFPRERVVIPSPVRPVVTEPEKELARCMLLAPGAELSMMELPRWLASHSSVNFVGRVAMGAAR